MKQRQKITIFEKKKKRFSQFSTSIGFVQTRSSLAFFFFEIINQYHMLQDFIVNSSKLCVGKKLL